MENVKVVIIDTGIHAQADCIRNVVKTLCLDFDPIQGPYLHEEAPVDFIGHGTAIADIICKENPNVDLFVIRICKEVIDIGEDELIYVLEYIRDNMAVSVINISAGITYLQSQLRLLKVCQDLQSQGVVIVSAFDNEGSISYPAALKSVIGVDITYEYEDRDELINLQNSIVDILVPDKYYRTQWLTRKTLIRGTSFAAALVAGKISKLLQGIIGKYSKKEILSNITQRTISLSKSIPIDKPFEIQKAIMFPLNKESDVIIRFKDMLLCDLIGIYDDRLTGNVGKSVNGITVMSFDKIDWSVDFDTVILSCHSKLSKLTRRNYEREIIEKCQQYSKRIYSFEGIHEETGEVSTFYPAIIENHVPKYNYQKLHRVCLPVVSVFGTSSKQGKFSLQLALKRELEKLQYNVGMLSSEPAGYLFGADYVFHFGYNSDFNLQPWQSVSILNEMIWNVQNKPHDILITGCQSNIIHYDNAKIDDYAIQQYAFALGVMPDLSILCVNPHDDHAYIRRSIEFIQSLTAGTIGALVLFPLMAVETLSGIQYRIETLDDYSLDQKKAELSSLFNLRVYVAGRDCDIRCLANQVIDYFSEPNL